MPGFAYNRNNVLAGAFLLLALALAVAVAFTLRQRGAGVNSIAFTVRFPLAEGAAGIKPGSPVLLGGQQIGRVTSVAFSHADHADHLPTAIDVKVETRADIPLFENAAIFLELPLLGSLSSINITDPGDRASVPSPHGSAAIEPGDVVLGHVAPPAFLAQAGFGPQQGAQVRELIANARSVVAQLDSLLAANSPKVTQTLDDVSAFTREVRADLERWSAQVDEILRKTDAAAAKADAALADARALLNDNRARIDASLANIESITAKLDRDALRDLSAALADARESFSRLSSALDRADALLVSETPSVRRILANMRLMSDQLKLTATEVRAQPWRLLVQPTTKEFESQVLYDATRAYAVAASDLRAASEALDAALATPASSTPNRDIDSLAKSLKDSIAAYKAAEQKLLDLLIAKQAR